MHCSQLASIFTQFWRDARGAAAGKYALLLAIVLGGLACVGHDLGGTISSGLYTASQLISHEVETVRLGGYD